MDATIKMTLNAVNNFDAKEAPLANIHIIPIINGIIIIPEFRRTPPSIIVPP